MRLIPNIAKFFFAMSILAVIVIGSNFAMAEENKIIVYGRESCPISTRYIQALDELHVPYEYKIITDSQNEDEMWLKLSNAGYSGRSVDLPVIQYQGKVASRPIISYVIQPYLSQDFLPQQYKIVVYGPNSGSTAVLLKDLTVLKINFEYKDISQPKANAEMFKFVPGKSVYPPVVVVNKKVLTNPMVTSVLLALKPQ